MYTGYEYRNYRYCIIYFHWWADMKLEKRNQCTRKESRLTQRVAPEKLYQIHMNRPGDQTFWWYMGSIKTPIMQKTTIFREYLPSEIFGQTIQRKWTIPACSPWKTASNQYEEIRSSKHSRSNWGVGMFMRYVKIAVETLFLQNNCTLSLLF